MKKLQEFELLKTLHSFVGSPAEETILGNGDDAAVIGFGSALLAISVDTFIEGVHFRFDWSSPQQVGSKCVHASCSDLCAVGSVPKAIVIALTLPVGIERVIIERLYEGLNDACLSLGMEILGGDTVVGHSFSISITALGELNDESHVCSRHGAQIGDYLMLSGELGGSLAGLKLFENDIEGFEQFRQRHCSPRCRADLVTKLAPHVHSMIDISDGLSGELGHISAASGVACELIQELLPLNENLRAVASELGCEPLDLVLHSGEEFELLYSVAQEQVEQMPGFHVGYVKSGQGVSLTVGSKSINLRPQSWEHKF